MGSALLGLAWGVLEGIGARPTPGLAARIPPVQQGFNEQRGSCSDTHFSLGIGGFFQTMHGDVSVPSCCAFIHRVAFEEMSGRQVLI